MRVLQSGLGRCGKWKTIPGQMGRAGAALPVLVPPQGSRNSPPSPPPGGYHSSLVGSQENKPLRRAMQARRSRPPVSSSSPILHALRVRKDARTRPSPGFPPSRWPSSSSALLGRGPLSLRRCPPPPVAAVVMMLGRWSCVPPLQPPTQLRTFLTSFVQPPVTCFSSGQIKSLHPWNPFLCDVELGVLTTLPPAGGPRLSGTS